MICLTHSMVGPSLDVVLQRLTRRFLPARRSIVPARLLSLALLIIVANSALAAENWPRWRGPRADGHSADKAVPTTWDASHVAWKTPLPGRGQSSPVIWENRIFLTTALEEGRKREV